VADLLGRLTLAEKIAMLHQRQPAIPRLGIRAFTTGTEALHGVAWLGPATVFPQAIGLASTWNLDLVRRVGSAVGDEVRGMHHADPSRAGLNVWAPVVNLLRDPRWGRNEEGYSEDPFLTGRMAEAYARGLRGDHPRYLKTAPTLKHFLAYNNETERHLTSSSLRPRLLWEYELPAYRPAIASGAAVAMMLAYNFVNGRPAHLTTYLNEIVRTWAPDELMVVSDAYAPTNIAGDQAYYPTHPEGHAAAVRAGLDSFTDRDADPSFTIEQLTTALQSGLLTESDIDRAVRRLLTVRFRLGEFDPPERVPYTQLTEAVVNSPAHRQLARQAAREAIVLLRNDHGLLPLDRARTRTVAVIGPLADTLMEDWYSGTLPYQVTPAHGIAAALGDAGSVRVVEGVDRIALRDLETGAYLWASDQADGAALTTAAALDGDHTAFDLFDWGQGVLALRSAANGRYLSAQEGAAGFGAEFGADTAEDSVAEPTASTDETATGAAVVINDAHRPGGWVVQQTFRLEPADAGGHRLQHIASGRYVTIQRGRVVAASDQAGATRFAVEVLISGVTAAEEVAASSDAAVVVIGNHPLINGRETEDRVDIAPPQAHRRLVQAVYQANPRTVLVLESSYPLAVTWEDEHLPALLWSAHGGQEFGHALADVLFGDYSPAGRLPQTWPRDVRDLPDLLDYDIMATGSTYLYDTGTPLYPFGHGLSYTTFEYRDLRVETPRLAPGEQTVVSVTVTNTGTRAGDEVVQLYTRQLRSRVEQPVKQLRGFTRVHIEPGQSRTVQFPLRADDFAFWDVARNRFVIERARHRIMVGPSSAVTAVSAVLEVAGEVLPPRDLVSAPVEAERFDDQEGVVLTDVSRTAGTAVRAERAEAWIAFQDVDCGTAISTVRATVTSPEPGEIQVYLDDPVIGPRVAVLPVPATPDRYAWHEVTAAILEPVTGIHDVYLVFSGPGIAVATVQFHP